MSLEAWGDEGDVGPEGYVTDERAAEMVAEALAAAHPSNIDYVLPASEAEVEAEFERIRREYRAPHCGCLASAKWYAAALYRQMVEYRANAESYRRAGNELAERAKAESVTHTLQPQSQAKDGVESHVSHMSDAEPV